MKKEYMAKKGFVGEALLVGIVTWISVDSYREGYISFQKVILFVALSLAMAAFMHLKWEWRRVSFILDEETLSYRVRRDPWVTLRFSDIRKVTFSSGQRIYTMEIIHSGQSFKFILNLIGRVREFEDDMRKALGDKVQNTDGLIQKVSHFMPPP